MSIKVKIGLRIKQLRAENQISQEVLSLLSGLDQSYLSGVENGKRNISVENIEKITQAMNISVLEFFNDNLFN